MGLPNTEPIFIIWNQGIKSSIFDLSKNQNMHYKLNQEKINILDALFYDIKEVLNLKFPEYKFRSEIQFDSFRIDIETEGSRNQFAVIQEILRLYAEENIDIFEFNYQTKIEPHKNKFSIAIIYYES